MRMVVTPRQSLWPTRREVGLAVAILLVIVAPLLLRGDATTRLAWPDRSPASISIPVPPRADDITVLLTNTPLAIAPADAVALNAARPIDRGTGDPARPFFLPTAPVEPVAGTDAALNCLTQAIYFEAASESDSGKRAVAQVVLNRMRSPIFPHTVCGVVFQGSQQRTGCQFSFTCDGSLARQPSLAGWMSARRIALAALSGSVERSIGLATHYHANYVVPYWAGSLDKVATIGAHIFYTMRGPLGRPPAFGARYDAMGEASVGPTPVADPAADATAAALAGEDRVGASVELARPMLDRTTVRDDMLGAPVHPGRTLALPVPTLRADEGRGELVSDRNKGDLASEHPKN